LFKRLTTMTLVAAAFAAVAIPGTANAGIYLTTVKAKQVARYRAWNFDSRVTRVKVDWFNRWSSREVHVGVSGNWNRSIYHSGCADGYFEGCSDYSWTEHNSSSCDATVVVKRNRYTGRVTSRVTDKSCFYG
jgi:hypothetical protein